MAISNRDIVRAALFFLGVVALATLVAAVFGTDARA